MASNYEQIGSSIGELVAAKQAAYGDAFGRAGDVLAVLYPTGIPLAKLDDALTVTRVIDKLFRIATDRDALGEDPWRDIAGYALLAVARRASVVSPKAAPAEQPEATPPPGRYTSHAMFL